MDALSALDPHSLLRASSRLRTELSRHFIAGTPVPIRNVSLRSAATAPPITTRRISE